MGDNSLGNLIKELQRLAASKHSASPPPPEKLTRSTDFARWRRSFPTMDTKAMNTRVLERLVAGFRDPQIRRALLRDRPPTLEKALTLAREEEVIQAACE
ncbi:unnamed protein product [Schistocephalus solidus]|uniref:Uncharacterized protein n=1 Tax=Schistocephalus solidus TaxID=70667 RepID=A0A183T1Z2_SCHSO|nr:unnamed protein product [Schistocephalus solidus]